MWAEYPISTQDIVDGAGIILLHYICASGGAILPALKPLIYIPKPGFDTPKNFLKKVLTSIYYYDILSRHAEKEWANYAL